MTTFQAVIYALIHGISEFLPISAKAHHVLVAYLLGWQPPSGALLTAFALGSLLAVFIYFRHDFASMISSVLQVIIFRKRPMTLDERIPLFIGVSTLPLMLVSTYFHRGIHEMEWNPLRVAGVLAVAGLPLWFLDYWNRKRKGMCDWNWLDAFIVGLTQATALFPGWDGICGILFGASFINYKREPALKYAYFAIFPSLLAETFWGLRELDFHASAPMLDFTWLSFIVAVIVTWFFGFLAIGGLMKHVQTKGFGQYVVYRLFLAFAAFGFYWFKSI